MKPYITIITKVDASTIANAIHFIVEKSGYDAKKSFLLSSIENGLSPEGISKVDFIALDRKYVLSQIKKLNLTEDEMQYLLSEDEEVVE